MGTVTVYRNRLRDLNLLLVGSTAALSLGFFGLFAALEWVKGGSLLAALGLLATGIALASILPLAIPLRSVPGFLVLQGGGIWAIYGNPRSGRRLRISWDSVTKLEEGPDHVQVRCPSPLVPGRTLVFNLPHDAYPSLVAARSGAHRSGAQ